MTTDLFRNTAKQLNVSPAHKVTTESNIYISKIQWVVYLYSNFYEHR